MRKTNLNSDSYQEIFKDILEEIEPDKKERIFIDYIKNDVLKRLRDCIKYFNEPNVEVQLAGSIAKDTYLKGTCDVDVFVMHSKNIGINNFFEWLKIIVNEAFKGSKILEAYAQHPYLQVYHTYVNPLNSTEKRNVRIDVVPSYKITDTKTILSSVDRTPLHTLFVKDNLKSIQKREVRLLKQFLKANGIYGAEHKTMGFSGYLCELLIIKYGTFIKVLEYFSKNFNGDVLILDKKFGYPKLKNVDQNEVNKIVTQMIDSTSPALIFLDPVDEKRNVAAAVSYNSLCKFILLCRAFLLSPNIEFFKCAEDNLNDISRKEFIKDLVKDVKSRNTDFVVIKFVRPNIIDDILYPQMKRAVNKISNQLLLNDFRVFGHYFDFTDKYCYIIFELDETRLPRVKKVIGPSIYYSNHLEKFIRTHKCAKSFYVDGKNIVAIENREDPYQDATRFISYLFDNQKIALSLGIPKNIYFALKSTYKIISINNVIVREPLIVFRYLYGMKSNVHLRHFIERMKN
ncbi:MAG: CCA tRNA nucleotidyltransferase [Candidatus Micrarchaeota archaeon]|nr:CCA tRNA nucleotidyltransferase [Candidatus Micrarchaeota archaeon]